MSRALLKQAKEQSKFVRRALRKHRAKLSEAAVEALEKNLASVEEARKAKDEGRLRASVESMEQRIDKNLAFARRGVAREYGESLLVAAAIALTLRAAVIEPFKIPSESMVPTLLVGDHLFVSKFIYGLRVPLTNSWFAQWGSPERGDVIVFRYPKDQSLDYIKRVVAVAGDQVRTEGIDLYVNGEKVRRDDLGEYEGEGSMRGLGPSPEYLEEVSVGSDVRYPILYRPEPYRSVWPHAGWRDGAPPGFDCSWPADGPASCIVQPGYVMVMGDNRDNSQDSRVWGGVPVDYVKGKALFIWWSMSSQSGVRWRRLGQPIP